MDSEANAIVVKDLHKSFGEQTVLDGIDLNVARGETLAVLGRSGTGKSVLLKLMIGLQAPDSGSIQIAGKEIAKLDEDQLNEIRKKMGAMDLKGATRGVIRKDSVATIRSEGLIGDRYVEIMFGTDRAPPVKNGDTIPSEPPMELSDLFKKASSILDSAQGAMQNVNDTTGNLKAISSKVNQGTGTIGALINDKSTPSTFPRPIVLICLSSTSKFFTR